MGEFYEKNKDCKYNYVFDSTRILNGQGLSRTTKVMIVSLFKDYFATDAQKERLEAESKVNEARIAELAKRRAEAAAAEAAENAEAATEEAPAAEETTEAEAWDSKSWNTRKSVGEIRRIFFIFEKARLVTQRFLLPIVIFP